MARFGGTPLHGEGPTPRFGGTQREKSSSNLFEYEEGDNRFTNVLSTMANANVAVAETAGSIVSGMAAGTVGGIWALGEGAYDALTGREDVLDSMVNRIEQVQKDLTYMPKTEMGEATLENVSMPFQKLEEGKRALGDWVQEQTGNPELATAAYMAPDVLLMMLGSRPRMAQRLDVKKYRQKADELGIDLDAQKTLQTEQVGAAAEKLGEVAGRRSGAATSVSEELTAVRDVRKLAVDSLYKQARAAEPAGIPKNAFNDVFAPMVEKSLRSYPKDMKIVNNRLRELQAMGEKPWNAVSINELEMWRQRLNRDRPDAGQLTQQSAIGVLKAQYDTFRDAMFNSDMIIGDAAAVTKWKNATKSAHAYAKDFKDTKVVKQLIEQEVTPEQARNWIFGAADVGFNAQAAQVVGRIEGLIGKNSPQMQALRHDAMFNIIDPLLKAEPNIKQFLNNYENVARKNPSVMKALFEPTQLKELHTFARAIQRQGTDNINVTGKLSRLIARLSVGHQIAVQGAKVGLAERMLDLVTRGAGPSTRRRILGEVLGYDPDSPLFYRIPFATKEAGATGALLESTTPQE